MGAISREQQTPSYEAAGEAPVEDVLEPEVLTLQVDNCTIVSDTAPDAPLYRLSRSIFAHHPQATTDSSPLITFERATSDPESLFHLARTEQQDRNTTTFYLTPASPSAPGTIELRLPRPGPNGNPRRSTQLEAHLHLQTEQQQNPHPPQPALFAMRPRWLSTTELNYLDASGHQLACEDRDGGTHRLVTTVQMPARLRDWLVAVWCLRIWREETEGEGGEAGAELGGHGYASAARKANVEGFGSRKSMRVPV